MRTGHCQASCELLVFWWSACCERQAAADLLYLGYFGLDLLIIGKLQAQLNNSDDVGV